ncbi:MAG TPA: hypothetical protein DCS43_05360 [Verrucomicrobia bacterium]|nr:hypothetical protein [Verrucomicrobiota bacterium]
MSNRNFSEILTLSLGSDPKSLLKASLDMCIALGHADGGSILGEEGPYLKFLFSNEPSLIGRSVPQGSLAGACLLSGHVIYTHAPSDRRHFDGVDSGLGQRTQYLLSVPIPSALPESGQGLKKAGGVLQLLYREDVMQGLSDALPAEYLLSDVLADSGRFEQFGPVLQILPIIAFGMEVMQLRQTSYQVIHELKNKMISGLSWVNCISVDLQERFPEALSDAGIQDDFDIAASAIREGSELARNYLQFTKLYSSNFEPTDLNTVLTETVGAVRGLAAPTDDTAAVEVLFAPCLDMPLKPLDGSQLKMAFFNLCKNAVEAMRQNPDRPGVLTVTSGSEEARLWVSIKDNGPGMPAEIAENLFSPFKTKKEGGTGLGLTIAKKIIDIHGGVIRCESNAEGTQFMVRL